MLALDRVEKQYPGGVAALRSVTVEIPSGDQVAVVGPSGSGKTTMLTILGTLERPTSGEVRIAGQDLAKASDRETGENRPSVPSRTKAPVGVMTSSRASTIVSNMGRSSL